MIELSNVSYSYNHLKDVIKGLSLNIGNESCVAIVGNSGCGKTTLLNIMAGIIKPDMGQVSVKANRLSYLMQDVTLLPYKTAFENVLLSVMLRDKVVDEKIKQKAIGLLRLFQIEDETFGKFPYELSGGMKQRIGLVQTLLTNPDFLLLDEPFNAIDVNARGAIESYIWDFIKREGITMVIITHNIEQALLLCDRIIIMGNNYDIHQVLPSVQYSKQSPSQRLVNEEFKKLFFETVDLIRS